MEKKESIFTNYYINEFGIIRGKTGSIIKPHKNYKGYYKIVLYTDKIPKNYFVHRLVAMKYIPNPMNYPEVNHKDGNKENIHPSNLEWCTGDMNRKHAVRTGLMCRGEKHPFSVMKDSEVVLIRERIGVGESFKKIYKDYQERISWWMFRDICRGKSYKHLV
jgi:hypothetical protein